ncbi:PglY protein [Actinomadura terrae]|uniref:PglY protein n=1 Tax=Actinomadura terrae TaxID=604353 RepID=UPI001FA6AE92|nr:PglY protein [Actinomadura terrae]
MAERAAELYLRDVLDIPEEVLAGDYKVELTGGFDEADQRIDEYVVTDQLKQAFRESLNLVRASVQGGKSNAAYLHGSFGSGKSHFMTVLHAILENHPATRRKKELHELVADNDGWLRDQKFMMVPFHLVGVTDLDSAILGGYAAAARRLGLSSPPVYRSDAMLSDARRQREFLADDAKFAQWLGGAGADSQPAQPTDDLPNLDLGGASGSAWTTSELDRAFAAPPGDELRTALESALLDGPFSAYAYGARGAADAYLPLENGLAAMSRHAHKHGYTGLILFLDELILWLQAHMSNQEKVNSEVSKLVKLIESGDSDRPVPIVSFVSRQRNLSQLVGEDVVGADVKNLEAAVQYLAGRFKVVNLEDTNLPEIIRKRILRPRPEMESALNEAFLKVESYNAGVKDALLDAHGATQAGWSDFRDVYPLSPALLNVLVALAGALQRERTGLKLLNTMLSRRRDDLRLGDLVPLGDLWDVLGRDIGEAFTDHLRHEAEKARHFHLRVRAHLRERYGSEEHKDFVADDRIVKTLILSALAPEVSALSRLTGARLAALNQGSIQSRLSTPGSVVGNRLRELIAAGFGEIRADGDRDPVFTLHLSDLDVEPLLEQVGEVDNLGARRIWVKEQLWKLFGVQDTGAFVSEREIVWRGSRRTVEFVFENVRDPAVLPDEQFKPSVEGRIRFVVDYPFDIPGRYPSDDAGRVEELSRAGLEADTLVWLPHHLSTQKAGQLGRLLKMRYLLERDRLDDYATHLASDQRGRVRNQLQAQAGNLESQLAALLQQLYGISGGEEGNVSAELQDGRHVLSLRPGYDQPRLQGGAGFEHNMLALADDLYSRIYPKHPDLDLTRTRKAVTMGELKTVLAWITRAMDDRSGRTVVDRDKLALLKRIVHPLELGEVHDGPLIVSFEWRRRIDRLAARDGKLDGDLAVEDVRRWIAEYGWTGLDKPVSSLIIAVYALLADRDWVLNGGRPDQFPGLEAVGSGWALRDQPKPSEQQYGRARTRAAALFGVSVPDILSGRNVRRLAEQIRERARELEAPVNDVRRALEAHAPSLGIEDPDTPRRRSVRHAADLLARLAAVRDQGTPLVQALADAEYDVSDQVLGSAMVSAPTLLRALDETQWVVLDGVRGFAGRGDDIGARAEQLVRQVTRAARADEFVESLSPVLEAANEQAVALLTEASRQARPVPTTPPPTDPVPDPEDAGQGAGQVSLTDHGSPSVPSGPGGGTPGGAAPRHGRRRVEPAQLDRTLSDAVAGIQADVRAFVAANPGVPVEITWEPVAPAGSEHEPDRGPDR